MAVNPIYKLFMAKITFVNEDKSVEVNSCTNLRKAARKNGIPIYSGIHKIANCHGLGLCGSCAVEIDERAPVSPKKRGEDKVLSKNGTNGDNRRLACQCLVYGDVEVKTLS